MFDDCAKLAKSVVAAQSDTIDAAERPVFIDGGANLGACSLLLARSGFEVPSSSHMTSDLNPKSK
eukprot:3653010-Amphidinium_carterae.1